MGKWSDMFDQIASGSPIAAATSTLTKGGGWGSQAVNVARPKGTPGSGSATDPKKAAKEAEIHRVAYMALLTHAIDKASANPNFNLDLQISELTARLSTLRSGKADLGKLTDGSSQLDADLTAIKKHMGETAKAGLTKIKQH